ncbi:MAG: hypothetical protein P1Q69_17525 [Candidatus Thorarchaeota archaeon]|nr:hypothetical protein [Candidatus Thorarchaeota archaeon]
MILISLAIVGGIADAFGYKAVSIVLIALDITIILGTLWIDYYDSD